MSKGVAVLVRGYRVSSFFANRFRLLTFFIPSYIAALPRLYLLRILSDVEYWTTSEGGERSAFLLTLGSVIRLMSSKQGCVKPVGIPICTCLLKAPLLTLLQLSPFRLNNFAACCQSICEIFLVGQFAVFSFYKSDLPQCVNTCSKLVPDKLDVSPNSEL